MAFSVSVYMVSSSSDRSFWCEMLAFDKYFSSESFQADSNSPHFSIKVRAKTCLNSFTKSLKREKQSVHSLSVNDFWIKLKGY